MPLYIGDYLADTMHLTAAEHGAYLLLIMHYWRTGPLPDDDRQLAAIARTERKDWAAVGPIVREFFDAKEGRLHHKRVEEELGKARSIREQASAAGKASAEKRARQRNASGEGNGPVNGNPTTVETPLPTERSTAGPTNGQRKPNPSQSPSPSIPSPLRSDGRRPPPAEDEKPPPDPKTALWRGGLAVLRRLTGQEAGPARKLLGRLVDAANADHVALLGLLERAEAEQPSDPVAWLIAAAQRLGGAALPLDAPVDRDPLRDGVPEYWDPWDSWGLREWLWRQPGLTTAKRPETGNLHYVLHGADAEEQIGVLLDAANVPAEARPNLDAAGEWLRAGITIKRPAVLEEARAMGQRLGAIRSLKVFDDLVRQAHARRAA